MMKHSRAIVNNVLTLGPIFECSFENNITYWNMLFILQNLYKILTPSTVLSLFYIKLNKISILKKRRKCFRCWTLLFEFSHNYNVIRHEYCKHNYGTSNLAKYIDKTIVTITKQ